VRQKKGGDTREEEGVAAKNRVPREEVRLSGLLCEPLLERLYAYIFA
jgi:hypothetical protein